MSPPRSNAPLLGHHRIESPGLCRDAYAYAQRRMRENPGMAGHIAQAMLAGLGHAVRGLRPATVNRAAKRD
jgi:hypothetical protein